MRSHLQQSASQVPGSAQHGRAIPPIVLAQADGSSVVAIVGWTEVIMPTVKHLVAIAIATAVAFVGAAAVGIAAIEHSTTQAPTNRFTTSKADFRLNDHQRLRRILDLSLK